MSLGEVITIVLGLLTIGTALVGTLIRTIFLGLRIRIDRLEERADKDHEKCMNEIMRLTRESKGR